MKLVSLNIWGGMVRKPYLEFIEKHAPSTDIFCFQEVSASERTQEDEEKIRHNSFGEIGTVLSHHTGYHAPCLQGFNWTQVEPDVSLGNAIFVKRGIQVNNHGSIFVHLEKNALKVSEALKNNWFTVPRLVQFVELPDATICNFHGLWHTSGKGDIPERISQSEKIQSFLSTVKGRKILCGDFNLDINTESLTMLEEGMKNLIKHFSIPTTRSKKHYPKIDTMPFADYTLVSPDVEVRSFSVPDIDVSDHLPMILEFE